MGMDNDSIAVYGHEDHEDASIDYHRVDCHYCMAHEAPLSDGEGENPERKLNKEEEV